MTTAGTALAVREGLRRAHGGAVSFVPFLLTLVERPAPGTVLEVEGAKIASLLSFDIWTSDPESCPLCAAGSKRVRPKGAGWTELVS